ncbi:MAG: hypothetical protein QOF62_3129 [Pyrinomonadaceae bacterium]|jgi:DNA-binding NarL/FixJ family response regulator|nr:hypothetical protein [Pyrinomonadaceae bacterium]
MSTAKKRIWIDDNPERERTAKDLGAEFVNVWKGDVQTTAEDLLNGEKPSLIILDHILDKTSTTNPIFKRGSTIAEAVKEQWPDCPVIGITNMDQIDRVDQRTRHTYDAFFPYDKLADYLQVIDSIEEGFAVIQTKAPSSAAEIVSLLSPPREEAERLIAALPHELKSSSLDRSLESPVHRWTYHLIMRPGFLYDRLWAATLLGLSDLGFSEVENEFNEGRYSGIFSTISNPRWWSGRLNEILYERHPPEPGQFSWQVGRRLTRNDPALFSRCYVCDEEFPETVAFLDTASDERHAMHLKHTVLHPSYKRELYFEDLRVLKD